MNNREKLIDIKELSKYLSKWIESKKNGYTEEV